jgi:hypothetical protein
MTNSRNLIVGLLATINQLSLTLFDLWLLNDVPDAIKIYSIGVKLQKITL